MVSGLEERHQDELSQLSLKYQTELKDMQSRHAEVECPDRRELRERSSPRGSFVGGAAHEVES